VPATPDASKKSQRDARRQEKVAEFQRKQRIARRNRRFGIAAAIAVPVIIVGLVAWAVVPGWVTPKVDPASIQIEGLTSFGDSIPATHTQDAVDYQATYGMNPPAGGAHNQAWLNCGIYDQPVPNENAVHDLEHGAVWITYNADEVSGDDLQKLRDSVPDNFITMSPYPDLPAPVVASAWNAQVELDGVDDPRLQQFIDKFWRAATAPEAGAACTGGIDAPGLVS
jgi:hypothetical protein